MKKILSILFCLTAAFSLETRAQTRGTVSFITGEHVYVRFSSAGNLSPGDTLFVEKDGRPAAALRVIALSSLSCVCDPVPGITLAIGDRVVSRAEQSHEKEGKGQVSRPETTDKAVRRDTVTEPPRIRLDKARQVSGRISVASYTGLADDPSRNTEKLQYTFSLNARNIADSKFSAESYITFVHRSGEWDKVKENLFNGLKIYSLSASWEAGPRTVISLGRRINPKFSGMGAVDGIQLEQRFGSFSAGIIGGFRPDPDHYGFNSRMFQYGGFLCQEKKFLHGNMQNTLAFVEQTRSGGTDRRFAYFQHSNSILTNLYVFGSAEFDLYNKTLNPGDSAILPGNPRVSNLYLSLRYRLLQKLSVSVSYSSRRNIVYYETYKSYLDKLLDSETRQGYSFQLSFYPVSGLSAGLNAGYNFMGNDERDSRNLHAYVTYRVPVLKVNTTASFTWIDASYVKGNLYSLGLSRDLANGKFDAGINYRYADYAVGLYDFALVQHIAEVNLGWRITGRLSLNLFYEGTFEQPANRYQRVYARLSRSF